jgi:predicted GH43/DUF377 family glycosyl hydrolase
MRFLTCFLIVVFASDSVTVVADDSPLDQRPQPWQRRDEPILSARTTKQAWCRIVTYSPHVIYHDGLFRMWYLGTSEASRSNDIVMGYAESEDGIQWNEHPGNPILTGKDISWGRLIQTPYVVHDASIGLFRMWFVSGDGVTRDESGKKIIGNDQKLAYGTSKDGIHWAVHDKPLFPVGRSPSVVQVAPDRYRMWMGSRPDPGVVNGDLYRNIYEFTSPDGLAWQRSQKPVVTPSGPANSTVYPYVIRHRNQWYMWYGCHIDGGLFEIFCATSSDGTNWDVDHEHPAFPAAEGKIRFDSKYTSTPCIVRVGDRLLLYYSARDWQTEYIDGEGRKRRDGAGVYAHIGVAELRLELDTRRK